MSDKYIMALYTHCLVARKEAVIQDMQVEGLTEKEYGMVRLDNVGEVLFQALLLDSVRLNNAKCMQSFVQFIIFNRVMKINYWLR